MDNLKEQICKNIDAHQSMLLEVASEIWNNPEIGYREFKTAAQVKRVFENLKIPFKDNIAITGCRAVLDTGKPGPTIALLGELDALYLPSHTAADKETGAVHVCGHHLQIASLLGAATALSESNIKDYLTGRIVFISVPSEEFGMDLNRAALKRDGKIEFFGGKQEMISLGVFDDVDAAIMVHSGNEYHYPASYNGFVSKKIIFRGKASHAGLSPELGVNALNAANIALNAINAQRETFRDEDNVRVHGIIVNGGGAVNIIPDTVEMEVQIRAGTIAAITDAAAKIDRSVLAGAMAMGAAVEIETIPGYMPLRNNDAIAKLYEQNLNMLNSKACLKKTGHRASSTDMGDLSCIIPILHAYSCGVEGNFHSCDFRVADMVKACIEPAKLMAMTAVDLLRTNKIARDYEFMGKEKYLESIRAFANKKEFKYQD